jgi:uncharacterized protein
MSDGISRKMPLAKSLFFYGICLLITLAIWFLPTEETPPSGSATASVTEVAPATDSIALAPSRLAQAKLPSQAIEIKTKAGKHMPFMVEIASTPKQQETGLMGRTELLANEGMLFVYADEQERHMWMHNTLIPLDMLFIDSQGVIVAIAPRATPMDDRVINSEKPARAVLELRGGVAAAYGIGVGDLVQHALFRRQ